MIHSGNGSGGLQGVQGFNQSGFASTIHIGQSQYGGFSVFVSHPPQQQWPPLPTGFPNAQLHTRQTVVIATDQPGYSSYSSQNFWQSDASQSAPVNPHTQYFGRASLQQKKSPVSRAGDWQRPPPMRNYQKITYVALPSLDLQEASTTRYPQSLARRLQFPALARNRILFIK
ncbi:hypothetical protein [Sansalvadorimonas verongulae]|uniref:hypothetical protein n=1 Tax=Sansalvadorimonas verongulae TaxID=2172824 RepID=UPI0012BB4AA2|nr:hypothetical protein [Sansalvadorimonas verongulae]MTI14406.1 hypothetical protein [Sansalvadorimonas verongulae]